ncbi:MAG: hypothetical protein ABEL76_05050, partial [Bradymonadaceae bacterium]
MGLLSLAAGCDTVAKVSFSESKFIGIRPMGFAAPGGSCGAAGANGSGKVRLRYVLREDDGTAVR